MRLNHAQQIVRRKKAEILARDGRIRLNILKARQGGVSTAEQADNLHLMWSRPGVSVMTLADTRERTDQIFEITKRAIENFPAGLCPRTGPARTREVTFPSLDSRFWTMTAGASRAGQSITLKKMHGSEWAFWKDPLATLNAAAPALERPGTDITLETTASAHGSEPHGFWVDSENGLNGYHPLFLPWWACDFELYRMPLGADGELGALDEEEALLVERHGLDLEQVKWRRTRIRQMGRSWFLQEYAEDPESCWLVAGDLFYDAEVLKYLQERAPEPKVKRHLRADNWSGHVMIYRDLPAEPWEREKVVIGVDTAEGGGGDRSAWVARTYPSWKLLEVFADNTIEPRALAALLNERGRTLNDAYLVVEKNGHGITVLRELRDTHRYPSSKIFHRTVFDQATKRPMQKIGWATTGDTKPLLLDAGRELFHMAQDSEDGGVTPSVEAVRDGFNVTRDANGKVELNGRDVLVAEMLAWQGRSYVGGGYGSFTEAI